MNFGGISSTPLGVSPRVGPVIQALPPFLAYLAGSTTSSKAKPFISQNVRRYQPTTYGYRLYQQCGKPESPPAKEGGWGDPSCRQTYPFRLNRYSPRTFWCLNWRCSMGRETQINISPTSYCDAGQSKCSTNQERYNVLQLFVQLLKRAAFTWWASFLENFIVSWQVMQDEFFR